MTSQLSPARALSGALEPFVGSVYFARECHEAYARLGFAPSSRTVGEVMMPDGPAYFTSRGSLLGQVPGQVVAAAFAVFNPVAVTASVTHGHTITDAATIRQAREEATIAQLHRVLGPTPDGADRVVDVLQRAVDRCEPAGRPLFSGVISGKVPTDPLGAAWFLGDAIREFRGDSHTAAWTAADLDAVEIGLLTERYWGLPKKSYVRTRAWSDEQLDAGIERLTRRGLLDPDGLTEAGRAFRESIELATDVQMQRVLDPSDDRLEAATTTLRTWSTAVQEAHGYPSSGPMDLANAVTSRSQD